jgi:hypothetical protein
LHVTHCNIVLDLLQGNDMITFFINMETIHRGLITRKTTREPYAVLVIGLYELLDNPTTVPNSLSHPGPWKNSKYLNTSTMITVVIIQSFTDCSSGYKVILQKLVVYSTCSRKWYSWNITESGVKHQQSNLFFHIT